jgi:hypothetical protein
MCSVRQPRQLLPLLPRAILQLPVCQSCRFRCLSTPSSLPSPSVTTPRATRDLLSRSHSSSKTEPAQARHSSVLNKTHETPPIMASATSFYDFEPADSTFLQPISLQFLLVYSSGSDPLPSLVSDRWPLLLTTQMALLCCVRWVFREGRAIPTPYLAGQASPRRQHRLQMWLHTSV